MPIRTGIGVTVNRGYAGYAGGAGATIKTAMVDWWELDAASGNETGAHAGIVLTEVGTIAQGPADGPGSSRYRTFNGSSNRFSSADSAALSLSTNTPFTWVVWINAAGTRSGGNWVIAKDDGLTAEGVEYRFAANAPGNDVQLAIANGVTGISPSVPARTLTDDTWQMVAYQHDPDADTIGASFDAGAFSSLAWAGGTWDGGNPLSIGAFQGGSAWFTGSLCKMAFWKRVLTSDELTYLYNAGNGRTYATL